MGTSLRWFFRRPLHSFLISNSLGDGPFCLTCCYLEHDLRELGEQLLLVLETGAKMEAFRGFEGDIIILAERPPTLLSSD
jgi:hypothetical protein